MIKKLVLANLVLFLALGTIFATGTAEAAPCYDSSAKRVTLSGKLILQENEWPKLESDGQLYELILPPFIYGFVEVEDGEEIQVEGFITAGHRWEKNEDEKHLVVLKATVRGKEYIIVHPYSRMGRRGFSGGHGHFRYPQ